MKNLLLQFHFNFCEWFSSSGLQTVLFLSVDVAKQIKTSTRKLLVILHEFQYYTETEFCIADLFNNVVDIKFTIMNRYTNVIARDTLTLAWRYVMLYPIVPFKAMVGHSVWMWYCILTSLITLCQGLRTYIAMVGHLPVHQTTRYLHFITPKYDKTYTNLCLFFYCSEMTHLTYLL